MTTINFLVVYTSTSMAVGLRGHGNDDFVLQEPDDYESRCPLETPATGSICESNIYGGENSDLCYFNFVKTPGPSTEENNFVPSIACSCNNDDRRWQCNVASEYLQALTEATFGRY
ncbi:hypothetical protein IV203_032136 [Nitzschia inconspicua]|uniref:Uncharacterized protein n=1 Tax=Nitzschia inconspicua TaxID=303405 RepID=A0A9K3LWK4_9STRA|nr:hypothetical protein IV203_032136 [Nitzschia inconspicua]